MRGARRARWLSGAMAGTFVLACAAHVHAQTARLHLTYEAPQACPDAAAFRDTVTARVGRDPFDDAVGATADVRIALSAGALDGRLALRDAAGVQVGGRELHVPEGHCEDLVTALALYVALTLEAAPTAEVAQQHDGERPAAVAGSGAARPPASGAAGAERNDVGEDPDADRPSETRVALAVSPFGALGLAPSPVFGGALSLWIARRRFAAAVEAWFAASPGAVDVDDDGRARVATALGGALACLREPPFDVCGLVRVGAFQAEGVGVSDPHLRASFFAVTGLRADVRVALGGPFSLVPFGEVVVLLVRPSLTMAGKSVWSAPPLGAVVGAGLEAAF